MISSRRKILSIILLVTFLITTAGSCLSFADNNSLGNSSYDVKLQELINDGLTEQEAKDILKVDRIIKQLEQNGQKFEMESGNVTITDSNNVINPLSQDDKSFIIRKMEKAAKGPKISDEKKQADIKSEMEKNPGRKKYRVVYDEEHWIEADLSTIALELYTDNSVKPYGYNEKCVQSQYPYAGNYTSTNELKEYSGVYYAKNFINVTINFGPANPVSECHITYVQDGKASYGIVNIANSGKYLNVADWYMYRGGHQAEAESQVIYYLSGSVGVTFAGVFSMSVNAGVYWTQYAYIRGDYGLYKYSAYYQ